MVPIITLSKFPWDQCRSLKKISYEEQKYEGEMISYLGSQAQNFFEKRNIFLWVNLYPFNKRGGINCYYFDFSFKIVKDRQKNFNN